MEKPATNQLRRGHFAVFCVAALTIVVSGGSSSCGGATRITELVVVVDTDLAADTEMDRVEIVADDGKGHSFTREKTDLKTLPLTLGATAGEATGTGSITFRATAFKGATAIVSGERTASFVRDESRMVHLSLCKSCGAKACGATEACGESGLCEPREEASLQPWTGRLPPRVTCGGVAPPNQGDGGKDGSSDSGDATKPDVQLPAARGTTLSPSPLGATPLVHQTLIDWLLVAHDPSATVVYTLNGAEPTAASTSFVGLVKLPLLANNVTIKWKERDTDDDVHSFKVGVDPALTAADHMIVNNVRFTLTDSPVVKVKPGAPVQGTADATLWNRANCPGCISQVTLGINNVDVCIYDNIANVHPGVKVTAGAFTVTPPAAPGVYTLKTVLTRRNDCADAQDQGFGSPNLIGLAVVGTIIVEP